MSEWRSLGHYRGARSSIPPSPRRSIGFLVLLAALFLSASLGCTSTSARSSTDTSTSLAPVDECGPENAQRTAASAAAWLEVMQRVEPQWKAIRTRNATSWAETAAGAKDLASLAREFASGVSAYGCWTDRSQPHIDSYIEARTRQALLYDRLAVSLSEQRPGTQAQLDQVAAATDDVIVANNLIMSDLGLSR
jgi:hypothetical protein